MRLEEMNIPSPEKIKDNLKQMDERIAHLTKHARTEGDLNELVELRQARVLEADKLIAARNIADENAKAKDELRKEILKLKRQHAKDHKLLVAMAGEIIPLLEQAEAKFPALIDLLFKQGHQHNNLRLMVGRYINRYGGAEIPIGNFPSISLSGLVDYPSQTRDILKWLRVLIPEPEKDKEAQKGQPEEVKSEPEGETVAAEPERESRPESEEKED